MNLRNRFVPECLRKGDSITMVDREKIWATFPKGVKDRLIPCESWAGEGRTLLDGAGVRCSLPAYLYLPCRNDGQTKAFRALLRRLDVCELRDTFTGEAKRCLPPLLSALCDPSVEWESPTPFYCPDLLSVLDAAMDSHAAREKAKCADTEMTRAVSENLSLAHSNGLCVMLESKSRSGKTKAVERDAAAYPGRYRLVTAQPGYAMRDLYAAMALGLGLDVDPGMPTRKIKEQVEFVLRHCGRLTIIIDEAHRLLGAPPSSNSIPMRLEWLRANTMNLHLPVALVTTPQFNDSLSRWHRKTGWNFGQISGRIDLPVSLPGKSSYEDILAVVNNHGPRIPEKWRQYIAHQIRASAAKRSEHDSRAFSPYLHQVRAICCLIDCNAIEAGRSEPNEADILYAVDKVIRFAAAPVPASTEPPRARPIAQKLGRPALAPTADAPQAPSRQTSPAPSLEMPATRQTSPLATAIV